MVSVKVNEMASDKMRTNVRVSAFLLLAIVLAGLFSYHVTSATPDGVTVTILGNTSKSAVAGGFANFTGNDSTQPNRAGGFIFTMNITGKNQNLRWKAFVGNVSGRLTLDDAAGATIFDWTQSTLSGRVFSTRGSSSVNWSGIGCANTNITEEENRLLNHSSRDDNISATFSASTNQAFTVGVKSIPVNQCRTLNIYLNSTTNVLDTFEESVIYDQNFSGFNGSGSIGNLVYTQALQANAKGYNNQSNYSFQVIVPERGESTWQSSTPYYFYVELS